MSNFDIPNLLCMFDKSLSEIIKNLEKGNVVAALTSAHISRKLFRKALDKIGYSDEEVANRL